MKFDLNQRCAPPPPSAVFDAGTITSVFERLHDLLDKFQGRSTPPPENVGSVRRSPTLGPSDNARPNPLTQVTDSAPQGLMRPLDLQRLCMSLLSRVLAIMLPASMANCLLHVLHRTIGSRFALGVCEIRPQRDCVPVWNWSTPRLLSIGRSSMSPPSHYYRDLDVLYAEYDHLCQSLESREASASRRRGDSPDVAPPDVASPAAASRPSRPDSSSHTGLRLSPQPGPSSSRDQRFASQDRPRPRDVSSDRSHHHDISGDRSRKQFVASDQPGGRLRFAAGDPPSPKRRRVASDDSSSPQHRHSSRASFGDASFERPPSRSSPANPSSPSREDKDPDDSSISAPVRAMIDFILKSFPESQASPSHPSLLVCLCGRD